MSSLLRSPAAGSLMAFVGTLSRANRVAVMGLGTCALAAVALFATLLYHSVTAIQIDGPLYRSIIQNKDLIADVLPPPAYIGDSYLKTLRLFDERGQEEQAALIQRARELEEKFLARQAYWQAHLPDGPLKEKLVEVSAKPALEFFAIWHRDFLPAIQQREWVRAREVAYGPLRDRFLAHRTFIEEVVRLAEQQHVDAEIDAARTATHWRTVVLFAGVSLVGVLCLVGFMINRRLTAPLLTHWKDSEQRTRQIIDSALDAVIVMDARGCIVEWNRNAEFIFGWPRAEVVGRRLSETIVPPQHWEAHERGLAHYLKPGAGPVLNQRIEITAFRRDGTEFPVELAITPLVLSTGALFSAFVRDITDRKQAEAQLVQAKEAAEAAARAKADFLATMSHEIRTPMNGVIGMTGLLMDTELDAEQREFAQTIRNSGDMLLTVINDILDFSKIEAGKMELEQVAFDLRGLLEEVLDLLVEKAHAKGIELNGLVYDQVTTAVAGDPARLRQVLMNLVGNALKFTHQGEVSVSVSLQEETPEAITVRVDISDTGVGIPQEAQARLFQAFMQADSSTTRKFGGTGLGLAICRRLVEAMGGQIGVMSAPGNGSCFWFTARLKKAEPGEDASGMSQRAELRGKRLLIVDDNATNRTILQHYALIWGMQHESAVDGPEALARMRQAAARGEGFDLAVLDMQMPDMDGLMVAKAVKAEPSLASTCLVLFSSLSDRIPPEELLNAGVAIRLNKPLHREALYRRLCEVLNPAEATAKRASAPAAAPPQGGARTGPVVHPGGPARSVRILLAEDNAVNQMVAVRMLENLGCRVDIAHNGQEAVAALAALPYDLVFMDCQMPEMDGFEATRAIRAAEAASGARSEVRGLGPDNLVPRTQNLVPQARRVPIVAMTANAMQGDRERCLEAGMDDYIAKPIKSGDLARVLAQWGSAAESSAEYRSAA